MGVIKVSIAVDWPMPGAEPKGVRTTPRCGIGIGVRWHQPGWDLAVPGSDWGPGWSEPGRYRIDRRVVVRGDQCGSVVTPLSSQAPALEVAVKVTGRYHEIEEVGSRIDDGARCDWCAIVDSDRKSTRLNSSHQIISYAVFCLKKKKKRGEVKVEICETQPDCIQHYDDCRTIQN